MPLKLLSSGGGSVLLTANTTGSDFTVNVPAVNGNMVTTADTGSITQSMLGAGVYGTYGPAFSAYLGTQQNINYQSWTKLNMNTEEFDTASCYDSATNYRFTPNVAGYYAFGSNIYWNGAGAASANIGATGIFKNGSAAKYAYGTMLPGGNGFATQSCVIYANGSTDYFEIYAWQSFYNGGMAMSAGSQYSYWSAYLARAA